MEEGVGESGARLELAEESREGDGSGKIELPELEDSCFVSQDSLESRDSADDGNDNTPMLTPEKLNPEFVNSQDMLEGKGLCPDHHGSSGSPVETQESIECRSFMEGDDYFAADSVSEVSTSVKNCPTVDDEPCGATSLNFEDKEMNLGKESEVVVMEIAERLSQLRSIGKTEESARKYILESDTSTEELEANDHMSELLGPKRLDFEVIDFDQFGAQPPDLPLNDVSTKRHHHGGVISSSYGGKEIKVVKKPESHVRAILSSFENMEQEVAAEMKGLHDNPLKKGTPEKKHLLRKERGTADVPAVHVISRLCNCGNVKEGGRGHDVSDTHSLSGRTGSSKLRLPDSMKPKKLSEAASGSPIRRSKSTMPDLKGSPVHEETRKRTEDHKRLEEYCNRVNLSTAKLEEQSRRQEELNRKLERECGERLKSEAKLKMLCELLPSVEANVKSSCDQMLSMEAQLQEQVGLRNKLEEALELERHERMQLVAKLQDQIDLRNELEQEREERVQLAVKLEDQIDLRNKLEQEHEERVQLAVKLEEQVDLRNKLEQEHEERVQLAVKLEEQVDLRNKLEQEREERVQLAVKQEEQVDKLLEQETLERLQKLEDRVDLRDTLLEQERQERMHLVAKQEDQINKLERSLEGELQERMQFVAKLEEQVDLRNKLEESLERELQERMQFAAKLEEQVELWNKLERSLERVLHERMQFVAKLEQKQDLEQERQERLQLAAQLGDLRHRLEAKEREQYEEQIRELASKLEQERNERFTGLTALHDVLPQINEKLVGLTNQVESLTSQLKEQTQLKEELQIKLDQGLLKMHEEMAHKFEKEVSSSVKKEISLKDLQDQVLLLATQLHEQIHLRKELEERSERMPNRATTERSLSIEEESVFTKMLDEQKELLANQVKEAEMLKSATEKKVGLLNDQVQNLEMLFKVVETKEKIHNLKERATRQTMWTILQALSVGVVLVSFIVACRSPGSFLHPTPT